MLTFLTAAAGPAPLGSIFAISAGDWSLISKRVGLALTSQGIAGSIEPFLPGFETFATDCRSWRATTFPGLTAQAEVLAAFAQEAIDAFTRLGGEVSSLDPSRPLPPPLAAIASATFAGAATRAGTIHDRFATLAQSVAAFVAASDRIDSKLESVVALLGPGWQAVGATIANVDAACGSVLGAWRALSDDLGALASGQEPITIGLIESLAVASAISGWRNVEAEATAFPSMANGQQVWLSGQWLN